ncbi:MAG: protein translocase subunit SecF, partial [Firmicutes bacterium]|nr:protein translocase subunit SecF [Bacillota bacterium]
YQSLNFLRHAEIAQHVITTVQNSYLGNEGIGKTYLQVAANSVVLSDDGYVISITISNLTDANAAEIQDVLARVMPIPDRFAGRPGEVNTVSERMGSEHLRDAILAIIAALVFMLVYIAFRFEVSMGAAAVLGLFHDLILMFSFMVIFHIEIGIVFFAALITLLGYSINNTIIIFDKVRENIKMYGNKPYDSFHVANISARDTLFRSLSTTITTLFPIAMIAIIGVPAIQIFALPIIVGLFSGTYSSLTIVPAVWAGWKRRIFKKRGVAVAFAGASANVNVEMPQEVESIVDSVVAEDKPVAKKAAVSKSAKPKIVKKTTKAVGAVTERLNENEVFEEFMDGEKVDEDDFDEPSEEETVEAVTDHPSEEEEISEDNEAEDTEIAEEEQEEK